MDPIWEKTGPAWATPKIKFNFFLELILLHFTCGERKIGKTSKNPILFPWKTLEKRKQSLSKEAIMFPAYIDQYLSQTPLVKSLKELYCRKLSIYTLTESNFFEGKNIHAYQKTKVS